MQASTSSSLRKEVASAVGDFLYDEKFVRNDSLKPGILEIINLLSDYREEGKSLFPEVLLTDNQQFLKSIPHKRVEIAQSPVSVESFVNGIKYCAPLATDGWIIFFEVLDKQVTYGIANAEISETSPSMYSQSVGQMKIATGKSGAVALIRNIGPKTAELVGRKSRLEISLTLDEISQRSFKEISTLSELIARDCDEATTSSVSTFFERNIDEAIKGGHGNLIAIVKDNRVDIDRLKKIVPGAGGVYLPTPINFEALIRDAEEQQNRESSVTLKTHASVLRAMLNHDGITIISTRGHLLGYHILINEFKKKGEEISGGSRSKAFRSIKNCDCFEGGFFKSQDGTVQVWVKQ
jgi:hypothetical protein